MYAVYTKTHTKISPTLKNVCVCIKLYAWTTKSFITHEHQYNSVVNAHNNIQHKPVTGEKNVRTNINRLG